MHCEIIEQLVPKYLKGQELEKVEVLQGGIINATYLVTTQGGEKLVLQLVNTDVFTVPELVMSNVSTVTQHLKRVSPESRNLCLLTTVEDEPFVYDEKRGLWRAFSYLEGCIGYEAVESEAQAYEAGFAFGTFLGQIDGIDASKLGETLPDFHNTPKRLNDFDDAVRENKFDRSELVTTELNTINKCREWISIVEELRRSGDLPNRVTHNDTKISNVLFSKESDKAVCVIDLDTVMPGTMLYDFGDLVRTSVNGASEDDGVEKVECRLEIFKALSRSSGGMLNRCRKRLPRVFGQAYYPRIGSSLPHGLPQWRSVF